MSDSILELAAFLLAAFCMIYSVTARRTLYRLRPPACTSCGRISIPSF